MCRFSILLNHAWDKYQSLMRFAARLIWFMRQIVAQCNMASAGRIAQSVTCLPADMCLPADPGVVSSILDRSHTFMEIDHEIISPFC